METGCPFFFALGTKNGAKRAGKEVMSLLNWWYAVPLSCSVIGFVLCAIGMYFIPNALEYDPDETRTRRWGWTVSILMVVGLAMLMAAGPLLWLPVWYG